MADDGLKIAMTLVVAVFCIYLVVKMFSFQTRVLEGMTNGSGASSAESSKPSSASVAGGLKGEAGTSENYAAALQARIVQLQDELLISKYKKSYENILLSMDDYIGLMTLKSVLNMNLKGGSGSGGTADGELEKTIARWNALTQAREALNLAMKVVDGA
jgi:hypothetical protein